MDDVIGAVVATVIGAAICGAGILNFRGAWKRVRSSRSWTRTTARITKAWNANPTGEPGGTRYNVNYSFTAPETGGSYYGHSEAGGPDMKTGDDVEVMYDPKGPYNNDLPLNRFEQSFYPIVFGTLTVFGAATSITALAATILMIVDPGL